MQNNDPRYRTKIKYMYRRLHVLEPSTCVLQVQCETIMLIELLYPLQGGFTPLHIATTKDCTACMERLLSAPGIDVNIQNAVSWSIEFLKTV